MTVCLCFFFQKHIVWLWQKQNVMIPPFLLGGDGLLPGLAMAKARGSCNHLADGSHFVHVANQVPQWRRRQ